MTALSTPSVWASPSTPSGVGFFLGALFFLGGPPASVPASPSLVVVAGFRFLGCLAAGFRVVLAVSLSGVVEGSSLFSIEDVAVSVDGVGIGRDTRAGTASGAEVSAMGLGFGACLEGVGLVPPAEVLLLGPVRLDDAVVGSPGWLEEATRPSELCDVVVACCEDVDMGACAIAAGSVKVSAGGAAGCLGLDAAEVLVADATRRDSGLFGASRMVVLGASLGATGGSGFEFAVAGGLGCSCCDSATGDAAARS